MANHDYAHVKISSEERDLMVSIGNCRHSECAVPQKHPFYPVPEEAPFYFGKRPCMPVVPTNLCQKKVMLIGEYPNCRFASVKHGSNPIEKFVPVADINEPFEAGRYFDSYGIRDYPTAVSLHRNYLEPLQLDLRSDVWLTNIIKCYLLKPYHIKNYQDVKWNTPETQASYEDDNDYFDIASVCMKNHLFRELALCQPKVVIAFGEKAYRMIHSDEHLKPAADITLSDIAGQILAKDQPTHPLDKRATPFLHYDVIHLYHPSTFPRGASESLVNRHFNEHIPTVKTYLSESGII